MSRLFALEYIETYGQLSSIEGKLKRRSVNDMRFAMKDIR